MGPGGNQLQQPDLDRLGTVDQPPEGRPDPATQGARHPEGDTAHLALPEPVGHGTGCLFGGQGGGPAGAPEADGTG